MTSFMVSQISRDNKFEIDLRYDNNSGKFYSQNLKMLKFMKSKPHKRKGDILKSSLVLETMMNDRKKC